MPKGASEKKHRNLREWLSHAFAVGDHEAPDPADLAALDRLAKYIVDRRLEAPAILFLQSCIPLSYIGSQVMVGLEPLLGPFFSKQDYQHVIRIFERRDGIDRVTGRIEELISERDAHGK